MRPEVKDRAMDLSLVHRERGSCYGDEAFNRYVFSSRAGEHC
jgi:hypothetical protein